jgi:mycobactin polyketide synthetase MbtD
MATQCLPDSRVPVLLSVHAEDLMAVEATGIAEYIERSGVSSVAEVAATLARLRRRRRHRAVLRAADTAELREGLRALAAGQEHPLVATSSLSAAPPVTFVFPGNGNQWPSMGSQAYRELALYRSEADRCAEEFVAAGVGSPLSFLTESDDRTWLQIHSQSAQFTHAVALAAVWRSHGIEPAGTLGHSLGEIAAAYLAGVMTLADAVGVVIARAQALDGLADRYRAASLGLTPEEAQQAMSSVPGWMELSVVNAPASVVVSGECAAIDQLVAQVQGGGRFARVIAMSFPAHTSVLESLRAQLLASLPDGRFRQARVPFVGSVTADVVGPDTDFGDYWYRNLRDTVRFDRAVQTVQARSPQASMAFVEISAHPALLYALGDTDAPLIVGTGHRDEPLLDAMSRNIAAAAVADPDYPWTEHHQSELPVLRGFPNAPMSAIALWAEPEPLPPMPGLITAAEVWEPQPESAAPLIIRRFAVLDLPGPGGALAQTLRAAVRADLGTVLVEPAGADALIVVAPSLDHPDVESAARDLAELIDAGLCDYPEAIGPDCRDVWLVTVGGEHVRPDEPVALPAQAALGAMHRSIGFAHPDQTFSHLDLPSWDIDDATAGAAIGTMLCAGGELALRDSTRFVRTLPEDAEPESWDLVGGLLDEVVITGGNGAVGLHFARFLASAGARRIVLLSRLGVDPAVLAELGEQVESVRCDITSPEQLATAAARHGADGATLVVHAAGAAAFGTTVSAKDFADTAAAKLAGLSRLGEHWPLRSDARILVCSSVSGLWGGHGHAAYAAVNRMADVMAGQQRADGRQCVAVRWGLWPGAGIADADEVAQIQRAGLVAMDAEMAVEAALREHRGDPLLFSADQARLRMFLGQEPHTVTAQAIQTPSGADLDLVVRSELAATLTLADPGGIDLTESLIDLGVDSLLALDLRKRLRRSTGVAVPLAGLLGGISGTELVALVSVEPTNVDVLEEKVET